MALRRRSIVKFSDGTQMQVISKPSGDVVEVVKPRPGLRSKLVEQLNGAQDRIVESAAALAKFIIADKMQVMPFYEDKFIAKCMQSPGMRTLIEDLMLEEQIYPNLRLEGEEDRPHPRPIFKDNEVIKVFFTGIDDGQRVEHYVASLVINAIDPA